MTNITIGSKVNFAAEGIIVEIVAMNANGTASYIGPNGERGRINPALLEETQIVTEAAATTIKEEIEADFTEFEIVVKSKEAQKLIGFKMEKKTILESGYKIYHTGVKNGAGVERVLVVETFKNGKARVMVESFYI